MQCVQPTKKLSCDFSLNLLNTFEKVLNEKEIALASMDDLNTDIGEESSNLSDDSKSDQLYHKINSYVYIVSSRNNESNFDLYI